jgi:regulator of sigma E protease
MSIIIFILILSFLILIHELGHYLAALWAKVKVDEFGLGYPPKAWKLFSYKGTDFTLNWIPFGGFVRMQGEEGVSGLDEETSELKSDKKNIGKLTGQFYQATTWQKLVIIFAGVTFNFIFGIVALIIVFTNMGIPEPIMEARIGLVAENSPAAEAGLRENTNITGLIVEDEEYVINNPDDLISAISDLQGQEIVLITSGLCEGRVCQDDRSEHRVYVRTAEEIPEGQGAIGIAFDQVAFVFYPGFEMIYKSIIHGVTQAMALGWLIVQAFSDILKNLFSRGVVPDEVAGPVGIVHYAQTNGIFSDGWLAMISFAGMLSINLAVINVLPLPPLDGGRAVFAILDALLGKTKTQKAEAIFNYVGYIFLLGLIILITIRDVYRLF